MAKSTTQIIPIGNTTSRGGVVTNIKGGIVILH
jgi:hypothetical protein